MVATTGAAVKLMALKEPIFPVPLPTRPIDGVLFVHWNTVPDTAPLNVMAVVFNPLHTTWLGTAFSVGVGFTVMVNVLAVPVQVMPPLVKDGVTVMVAVTGAVPIFTALKLAIGPVPLAASPIDVVLFVQLYTVPVAVPIKVTVLVALLLQTTWLLTGATVGVGLTVMVNNTGDPVQVTPPLVKFGVTVIVAITGEEVVFTAVKGRMFPVPLPPSPIDGVVLVQVKTVPDTVPLKVIVPNELPLHTTWLATAPTVGTGFTTTVAVMGVPVQVTPSFV
jgi:hypothetical protein